MSDRPDDLAPPSLPAFIRRMLGLVWWPALALPPLAALAIVFAMRNVTEVGPLWNKDVFEVTALVLLWTSFGVAALRLAVTRHVFFVWLLAFVGVILFREYHLLKQSTTIALAALAALGVIAWLRFPRMAAYLGTRRVVTILAMITVCYATTSIIDWDFFKYGAFVYPIAEELIECVGHVMMLVLTLVARPGSVKAAGVPRLT